MKKRKFQSTQPLIHRGNKKNHKRKSARLILVKLRWSNYVPLTCSLKVKITNSLLGIESNVDLMRTVKKVILRRVYGNELMNRLEQAQREERAARQEAHGDHIGQLGINVEAYM